MSRRAPLVALAFDVHGRLACLVEISLSTPRSKNEKPSTSRIPTNLAGSQRRKQSAERGRPSTKRAAAAICRAAGAGCPIRTARAREVGGSEANALGRGLSRSGEPRRRRRRPLGSARKVRPSRRRRPYASRRRPAPRARERRGRSGVRGPALPVRARPAHREPSARACDEGLRARARRRSAA